jgi:hypothetical protein
MKGTNRFTAAEADRIRRLLRQRATAERAQQKRLRDELRAIGFYISDWSGPGFTPSDFDELIRTGGIMIIDASRTTARPSPRGRPSGRDSQPDAARPARRSSGKLARVSPAVVKAARAGLTSPRHSLAEADSHVAAVPGLYAIYGGHDIWPQLGLGDPPDDRPLYVGKAEESLVSRDLKTHFGSGRTGSSTVRRSFAALLRGTLDLRARPRNPANPDRFANYGLPAECDERLTRWMCEHLSLAVWPKPVGVELICVERKLLTTWEPPLNLKDVRMPWTDRLSQARKVMADEARAWAERN